METLGNSLRQSLTSSLKSPIAKYLQRRHMPQDSLTTINARLDELLQSIEMVSPGIDPLYKVVLCHKHEGLGKTLYCGMSVKKVGDATKYAADFIPFAEIFRYGVEGYEANPEMIGDMIWDLTYDGWTCAEQEQYIKKFESDLA